MRLTIKNRKGQYKVCGKCGEPIDLQPAFNKLGRLENIEQELGIDLNTLFKALKNGFWYKYYDKVDYCVYAGLRGKFIYVRDNGLEYDYFIKDYGKTWSLRKEDLVNYIEREETK